MVAGLVLMLKLDKGSVSTSVLYHGNAFVTQALGLGM